MSTLQEAAQIIRLAGTYYSLGEDQEKSYLELAAELERMADAKPIAHCAMQECASGDTAYAEDCFSGSPFTGSVPVYAVPPDAQAQIDAAQEELRL